MTAVLPSARAEAGLRDVFRQAASSTWLITTRNDFAPVGFTAISVVSVSVEPELVAFNLSKTSSSREAVAQTGRVALHLLAEDQEYLARRFAGPREERFAEGTDWAWHHDRLPAVDGVVARLDCDVVDLVDAGDSFVVIARVRSTEVDADARPLVHHRAGYHSLTDTTQEG